MDFMRKKKHKSKDMLEFRCYFVVNYSKQIKNKAITENQHINTHGYTNTRTQNEEKKNITST